MPEDFTNTLNLPKTNFAMRANLPKREPEIYKYWEEIDLYGSLQKHNANKPLFVMHDGPPYANGDIHIGHALNKILKDFIVSHEEYDRSIGCPIFMVGIPTGFPLKIR